MADSRVILRRPTIADGDEFINAMKASRRFHRPWVQPPLSAAAFKAYLKRVRMADRDGHLVCLRGSGAIVGVINLNHVIRRAFQSAFLGYYAVAEYAGQGLMFEGMELTLRYAFRRLKLHRLEANIQPGNSESIALVKRCGFVREGFSRRYLKIDRQWSDHERWALLAEDWSAPDAA